MAVLLVVLKVVMKVYNLVLNSVVWLVEKLGMKWALKSV